LGGIAGIFHLDGSPVEAHLLQGMLKQLNSRGPHGDKTWQSGAIGLGCAQLERGGGHYSGNLLLRGSNLVIAADARLDNRPELCAALSLYDDDLLLLDEAIILESYKKWGETCAEMLRGDFAFAIWDPEQQHLYCARDHFGVKPFYYLISHNVFIFGSSPRAILAGHAEHVSVNEARIADFLVNPLEGINKTCTFYQGIDRLPPASQMIAGPGKCSIRQYWYPQPIGIEALKSEGEYVEAFTSMYSEAVRARLDNAVHPATMLSGGLDSSSIVALAREIARQRGTLPLEVFAGVATENTTSRETAHIMAVIQSGDIQAHAISTKELPELYDEMLVDLQTAEEPFDAIMTILSAVNIAARQNGVTALLDGIDGDMVIKNPGNAASLWRTGNWHAAFGETLGVRGLIRAYEKPLPLFLSSLRVAFVPDWMRKLKARVAAKSEKDPLEDTLINRDFARDVRISERMAEFKSLYEGSQNWSQVEAHQKAIVHPFLAVGVERYERVAAQSSLEARHPLLDVRLVEFCLGLPWQLKTHRGWTKNIMRLAMQPYLPSSVVWRTDKDHLGFYFTLNRLKGQSEIFQQVLHDEWQRLCVYIDEEKLRRAYDGYFVKGDQASAEPLWEAISLAFWLKNEYSSR
jgi:asparagine synthase (glutamine-hydrolysing)